MIKNIFFFLCFCIVSATAQPTLGPLTQMDEFQVTLVGEANSDALLGEIVEAFKQVGTVNVVDKSSNVNTEHRPLLFLLIRETRGNVNGFIRIYSEIAIVANQYKTVSMVWSVDDQSNSETSTISALKTMVEKLSMDYYRQNPLSSRPVFNIILAR